MTESIYENSELKSAKGLMPKYQVTVKDNSGKDIICADPKFNRALIALMNMGAVNGGAACHWGGPAGCAEVLSALHALMFKEDDWYKKFNFVNDIGHAENGLYALRANYNYGGLKLEDLKGFRSISSKLTGHGEYHLYPEGVLLSNGPLGSALAQSQGLALSDKLKGNKRITTCLLSDGAFMEGEAKESFSAIAGLFKKGKINPYILILSDNNTKLSGRIEEDSFDLSSNFEAMESLGWKTLKLEQGNDLQKCYSVLEQAVELSSEGPVFLWVKTVKGYGVKSTEASKSGGHGFPLKPFSKDILPFLEEVLQGEELPSELRSWGVQLTDKSLVKKKAKKSIDNESIVMEKAQAGFSRAAIKARSKGLPVVSVSSDLQGSTGMAPFHKEFPKASFDLGIAESNMVSSAAGLSKGGYIPIVDTFAAFGVTKGNLPLIMAALNQTPIIAVFSHTGMQDAADGASHQSLTYLSSLCSIPKVKVTIVSTSEEAHFFMQEAINEIYQAKVQGRTADCSSHIFFVGRENFPSSHETKLKVSCPQLLRTGADGTIVASGPMVFKALEAHDHLKSEGVHVNIVNNHSINHFDADEMASILDSGNNKLITIEDHQVIGGMGAILIHNMIQRGVDLKARSLGVKGAFGRSAYSADELYSAHHLTAADIVKAFNEIK